MPHSDVDIQRGGLGNRHSLDAVVVRGMIVGQTGALVEITWPRPTIAQIMQMPMEQLRQFRLPFQ